MVKVQREIFNCNDILDQMRVKNHNIGAIVSFLGLVRDFNSINKNESRLFIEQYDGMTLKELEKIKTIASKKWSLIDTFIVHRYGWLFPNDPIVFIIVASMHRDDAFDACRFIIDFLKTDAPFWKKEVSNKNSIWVEQKSSDLTRTKDYY
jgi:molybdopterin synthase catalytic subunit